MKKLSSPSFAAPDADRLHAFLRATPHPVRLDDLLRALGVSRKAKKRVAETLDALADAGRILRLRGGKWADAGQVRTLTGVLSIQRSGAGFVTPQQKPGDSRPLPDLFIPAAWIGGAWHGDTVEAALLPGSQRGAARAAGLNPEGRVLRVVRRGVSELAVRPVPVRGGRRARLAGSEAGNGAPEADNRSTLRGVLCRPADPRFPVLFDVDVSALPALPGEGELILATPGTPLADGLWTATAKTSLGVEDAAAVQERLTRLNHNIPLDFPPNVEAEAAALEQARPDLSAAPGPFATGGRRIDLRDRVFVTIDGADARDFDDAICVEQDKNALTLWVAIADVSLYVRPRTALDREACARGCSCYFPCSVTPMLPERLCNDLCSLRPDEARPVLAARLRCAPGGDILSAAFAPALIRSRARLTYTQVQALLDTPADRRAGRAPEPAVLPAPPAAAVPIQDSPDPIQDPDVAAMLRRAAPLAAALIARRARRGGLDLDLPEAEFVFDAAGRVCGVRRRERLFAHRLIEAFMLAANEAVARFLTDRGLPFPLRAHPAPDRERLTTLYQTLRETALADKTPARPDPAGLRPLLDAAAGTPQAALVSRLVLRAMMQARYIPGPADPDQALHFGLASPAYCHFTSPIRRYPDLMVHRALKLALETPDHTAVPAGQKLLAACDQCNTRERAAQDAEREVDRRLACLLLEPRVGEVFAGTVSGVTDFGFFVEPEGFPADGMVRLEQLGDDWYDYDAARQCLTGTRSGRRIALGQPVRVRLLAVNVGRLEIDFVPEENAAGAAGTRTPRVSRTPRNSRAGSARAETRTRPRTRPERRAGTAPKRGRKP